MAHWCMTHTHGKSDTDIDSAILDQTVDSIKKQSKIDCTFDLPYVAGYNTDGSKIFIDQHVPEKVKVKGKSINVWQYLILHEAIEKALLLHLKLHYQLAHQIALRSEQQAVENDGVNWDAYNKVMQGFIKADAKERLVKVPKDLDLQPYRDEHDTILLKHMLKVMKNSGK